MNLPVVLPASQNPNSMKCNRVFFQTNHRSSEMQTTTIKWCWLTAVFLLMTAVVPARAQERVVTLTLNTATIPDTTNANGLIEVRGTADNSPPDTLSDGNIIDWGSASTLEPTNIGGDYWRLQFEIADSLQQFKFFSQQAEDAGLNGWEADPNPKIGPAPGDTTLPLHYFESQSEWRGVSGDRGEYDWRPFGAEGDSVAVWFRVFMKTRDAATNAGYDAENPDITISVRGGPPAPGAPSDWGEKDSTIATLTREVAEMGKTGYDLYSGQITYPASAIGMEQKYKFTVDDDAQDGFTIGWESISDRAFTVPAQDSTLRWKYFNNDPRAPIGTEPVAGTVLYSVDLAPLQAIGVFDRARGDTLEVRGDFNGWDCDNPDDCLLLPDPFEPTVFSQQVALSRVVGSTVNYKYFINFKDDAFIAEFGVDPPAGWEEPLNTTGANRVFEWAGEPLQDIGRTQFNNILSGNIMPDGVTTNVTFTVDMSAALLVTTEPFVPSTDSVFVLVEDPIWNFTQGIEANAGNFARLLAYPLTLEGANVYSGVVPVTGPTYAGIGYKYTYGRPAVDAFQDEAGQGLGSGTGRRRVRFVPANGDGSWPADFSFPSETYQPEGALPFEENPTLVAVEPIDGELPQAISLSQNYPNPFNPTTTFEYAINAPQRVQLHVYDLIGRRVATLVDGVQPANAYRVNFDAKDLASGTYFYRLETADKVMTRTMVLLK
ncbi:MAG: T9SS type A sorting domain-containing protein [Rhodothermales bacterium]|nr:T9SS type A sorting domain-containing protein [Rhodothermales bacterium]